MFGDTARLHPEFLRDPTVIMSPLEVNATIEQVLAWECDGDPEPSAWESTESAVPGRYNEKTQQVEEVPSWRLRYQIAMFSYLGLIDNGNLKRGALAEKLLMALTDRRTSALERMGAGDWQILAYVCDEERTRVRSRRVANPGYDTEKQQFNTGMYAGQQNPTKTLRVGSPDSTLMVKIVWYDKTHDVEVDPVLEWKPKGGVVTDFIRTGKLPKSMAIERQECIAVMSAMRNPAVRAAKLPASVQETIARLKGRVSIESAAEVVGVHPDIVGVMWSNPGDPLPTGAAEVPKPRRRPTKKAPDAPKEV